MEQSCKKEKLWFKYHEIPGYYDVSIGKVREAVLLGLIKPAILLGIIDE